MGFLQRFKAAAVPQPGHKLAPPNGGYGWVVVLASFLALFATYGVQYTYGVFQQQYLEVYRGRATTTEIAFVGSVAFASLGLFGVLTGRVGDWLGYRITLFIGMLFMALGLLLASFATEVWHLYLTQGLMFGIGTSLSFYPAVFAPTQWFDSRRGLATGIAMAGSGLGGMAVAPITRALITAVGTQWALRCLSAGVFVFMMIAILLLRPAPTAVKAGSRAWVISLLKNPAFLGLWATNIFGTYAVAEGLSKTDGATLVSIMNGASAAGRILLGLASDHVGRVNTYIGSVFIAGVACFAIWVPSTGMAPLVIFSLLYGFFMGGFVALTPLVITVAFGVERMATTAGMIYASTGVSNLIGSPIAGAILDATIGDQGYVPLILYAGAMIVAGSCMAVLLVRRKLTKGWLVKV
ncbi:major facilitator superfamily domain-containing protein [Thamnocephalis sphaerospora]|uniref:Major facilitator superfamily domain-containing protein n=1 Tax=Thamnocephalis sphaerospora TaxID=78915 RepID=A0A4P9XQ71_9FUNG|nr:major facilitator superfamily domain-containing protein [Thamnocephalis sphaerospora]|eukprot:RKP08177.1 major facilitator superfamily domain-containing protein [Thamnocephalis sphaerospora]